MHFHSYTTFLHNSEPFPLQHNLSAVYHVLKRPEPNQRARLDATPNPGRVVLGSFKKQELMAIVEEVDEDEEFRVVDTEECDNEDPSGETKDVQAEEELSGECLVAP